MTTHLERLLVWMERENVSAQQLQKQLRYVRFGTFCKILNGTMSISEFFTLRFAKAFGPDATREVFGIAFEPEDVRHYARSVWRPDYFAAHRAVMDAVKVGTLLPAKSYKCHGCDSMAQQYHHESYLPSNRLCVVPLCRKCHRRHHTGRARLAFGVVPTRVGLIRIAIAGA